MTLGAITKNTWYSFAVYFPSVGYEYDDEREVINQWYQNGSPATSLRTQRDRMLLETGNTEDSRKQYDIGAISKNRWHTFVFHFIHSYGTDGLIELWYDGTKKLTIRGGNMYDDILPKWKIGLYKSAFKYGTSAVNRRIIYFDNIRVGNEKATYATMRPAYY
ncbi:MAG: polysaccharide lyase [Cyclobacteriaceae bacterium]